MPAVIHGIMIQPRTTRWPTHAASDMHVSSFHFIFLGANQAPRPIWLFISAINGSNIDRVMNVSGPYSFRLNLNHPCQDEQSDTARH